MAVSANTKQPNQAVNKAKKTSAATAKTTGNSYVPLSSAVNQASELQAAKNNFASKTSSSQNDRAYYNNLANSLRERYANGGSNGTTQSSILTREETAGANGNNANLESLRNSLNSNLAATQNERQFATPGQSTAATSSTPQNTTASDSVYWSQYDQKLPDEAKTIIGEAKNEYAVAQKAGDQAAMKAAYNKAQKARAQYGSYIDSVGDGSGYSYFGKESWSDADLQMSPEHQDLMLQYKQGYALADNDADRKYWNTMAENLRKKYGYSGGADGSQYNELGILDREYNDTSQYESQYLDKINNLLTELENAEFSYDYATDPSYQAYLNAFTRQGNSAAEAAMAQSAANTGGVASSYAAAGANQMQQAYAQKAADMIPQLEQQAYERYANDISNRFNLANLYGSLDQNDYQRFADNKNFNFNQWQANYDNAYQQNYDNLYFNWLREQLEKTLADTAAERDWQSKENQSDRELEKYIASLR